MPDERKIVPFGPYLSPGTEEVGGVEKFLEKLLVRTFPVAIIVTQLFNLPEFKDGEPGKRH